MSIHSIVRLFLLPLLASCCTAGAIDPGPTVWTQDQAKEYWLKLALRKDVRKAMRAAWAQSRVGTSGFEAGFRLDGDVSDFKIVPVPRGSRPGELEVEINGPGDARTFAIFHVHPNASGPNPSTPRTSRNGKGDTSVADQFEVSVFVMHLRGLTVYDHSLKQTILLQKGLSWVRED